MQRAGDKARRGSTGSRGHESVFGDDPDCLMIPTASLKIIKIAVRGPIPAALKWRFLPIGEKGMKILAIRGQSPRRTGTEPMHCTKEEANSQPIGRVPKPARQAGYFGQLVR